MYYSSCILWLQTKNKEETSMKTRKRIRNPYAPKIRRYIYPNAADRSYFVEKFLDGVTAVLSSMGIITILFFLITM